ncbi:DNA (cytosine-5-)-methyltransferase [Bacillus sp. FSL M8-0063]|uniref:DNA (cytosine-5-)-methyltransferase n=1 Tax=Bacillus sp. FSL M8-0063 TaxID=2921566 RepID=UPI0030F64FAF
MSLTFIDLFAGIGGFRLGMEQAGHKCLGYVEWDKFARKSYEAIHNTEGEWTAHDITTVTNEELRLFRGKVDVICGGFPCQAFSIAGKRLGFAETRGTLFFEIARFAKEIQPQYLFLENVKGLLNHDGGNTFRTILSTLDELGYDAEWQVLNSKDFGVPQNRERVFIIGHLRGRSRREVFPIRGSYETPGIKIVGSTKNHNALGTNYRHSVHEISGIVGALSATDYKQPKQIMIASNLDIKGDSIKYSVLNSKTRRGRVGKGIAQTLDTSCNQATIENKPPYRIRRLTPRECWRLQGFPDWAFDKAQEVNSDSQLYKQSGNSVTETVIHEIAKRLV